MRSGDPFPSERSEPISHLPCEGEAGRGRASFMPLRFQGTEIKLETK